jgi:hypothetical protein
VDSAANQDPNPPDCTACGTCCFAPSPEAERYLRVDGDDHARLGDRADDLVVFVENRAYMRIAPAGHCAALTRRDGRWLCSVYEVRPRTCRDLERGSPACRGEIATKAALVALRTKTL